MTGVEFEYDINSIQIEFLDKIAYLSGNLEFIQTKSESKVKALDSNTGETQ